jgi:glycine betaine/choline ABC-type transport system substrate-binding protein
MRLLSLQHKLILILVSALVLWVGLIAGRKSEHRTSVKAAFGAEFLVRPDGYRGLARHYDFQFRTEPIHMMDGLLYKALSLGSVDVIDAFSTDGRIKAYDLVVL